jgi:hypothetical protein
MRTRRRRMLAGLTRRTQGRKTRGRKTRGAQDKGATVSKGGRAIRATPASRLVGLATPLSARKSVGIPHLPHARINTCPQTHKCDAQEAVARPAVHSTHRRKARDRGNY